MENKSKTAAIIGTAAAVLFCGCPGLTLCVIGAWAATGKMPYTTTTNDYSGGGFMPTGSGFAMLCAAIFLIAIPIVVGLLTLRDKKPRAAVVVDTINPDEPLPPPA